MASSGNFGSNNTLIRMSIDGTDVPTNGNRTLTSTSGSWGTPLNMAAKTGKWYIEYYVNSGSSGRNVMVVPTNSLKYQQANYNFAVTGDYVIQLNSNGSVYNNNDSTATQSGFTVLQTGDIMAMALNLDASPKTLQFYRNGTSVGTAENINASATGHFTFMHMGHNGSTITVNAGQDSSFAGAKSTGTANAADDNGFGNFYYTPPSGFLAMCAGNLPIDENIDPAQTDNDIPQKQFNAITYTGTGSTQAISGLGFQPDLVWIKDLSSGENNRVTDSSRGVTKAIRSDISNAELTDSGGVTAFGTDGFTVGNHNNYNASTNSLVAWCWKANGGTTATDSTGTITSSVQANTKGGFSIVTYTGTGTAATIGHGLGKAPELIFVKNRDAGDDWAVYHVSNGNTHYMILNTNGGKTDNTYWNDTSPTSSVFSIGTDHKLNASTEKYVAYCWAPIEGYSKFGVYTSNQNADGPFNYTGFRPKMIFVKMVVSGDGWGVWDSERSPTNVMDEMLRWDSDNAQATGTPYQVDFLANGFKIRTDNAQMNHNSYDPYIWGAWGDVPYKYNNGF